MMLKCVKMLFLAPLATWGNHLAIEVEILGSRDASFVKTASSELTQVSRDEYLLVHFGRIILRAGNVVIALA
jgi:hypothetical protein